MVIVDGDASQYAGATGRGGTLIVGAPAEPRPLLQALEVGARLHLDEGTTVRVLHHTDAVPDRCIPEQLLVDLAAENDGATLNDLNDADGGDPDNITVILVRFDGPGLRAPMQPLDLEEGAETPSFAPPEIPESKPTKTKPLLFGQRQPSSGYRLSSFGSLLSHGIFCSVYFEDKGTLCGSICGENHWES